MNALSTPMTLPTPWYRQFWPWFLIAGPAIVIVAACFTAWLAISTSDGLVADDYYKEGLKAGETLAQSDRPKAMGIVARLAMTEGTVRVRLQGRSESGFSAPAVLRLTLSHPTRAGVDQTRDLVGKDGEYVGNLNLPRSGHWLVLIEDDAKTWRLMASVQLPSSGESVIGGATPADIRSN
jgi:uncharacterized protein